MQCHSCDKHWSVIDHSRRRGHSVASKHFGLRRLWLQEVLENRKLELEKVDTTTNPADVCTKSLPGNRIRELCRLARVYVCCSEGDMGESPDFNPVVNFEEISVFQACTCDQRF